MQVVYRSVYATPTCRTPTPRPRAERVIPGFDTAALLDEGLDVGDSVRRFVAGWTRPLAPGDGWSEADLPAPVTYARRRARKSPS